jgi:hypothetical protein
MKSLSLFLLIIGIVMITMGYMDLYLNSQKKKTEIEYRFVPRDVFEEISTTNKYNDLFDSDSVLHNRRNLLQSNLV